MFTARSPRRVSGGRAASWLVEPGPDGGAVLVEPGRRQVGLAAPAVRVVVEAQGGPGQLDRAEDGVLHREDEALRAGLVPVVDLVDAADLARRDAELGEPGEQVGAAQDANAASITSTRCSRWSPGPRCSRAAGPPGRCRTPRRSAPTSPRRRSPPGPAPSEAWNSPYGASAGWWLPWARPTCPATVYAVPWKAWTPTTEASSEVRTTRPRPVISRSRSAAATP